MLPRLLLAHRLLAAPLPRGLARRTAAVMSAAPTPRGHRSPLRGVVFDMDGTLTVPVIDFPAMYREVLGGDAAYAAARAAGGGSVDILHCIESWAPDEQRRAYEVIVRFEQDGLDRLQIMPGASELCGFLDAKQIRRGLITRNVKDAVDLFHQRFGMMFVPALSREFCPYKPDPAPLLHICSIWNIPPNEVMMVGDSLKDDVVCGKRAGAFTCLLDETGRYGPHDSLPEDVRPDFKVSSLSESARIPRQRCRTPSQLPHFARSSKSRISKRMLFKAKFKSTRRIKRSRCTMKISGFSFSRAQVRS